VPRVVSYPFRLASDGGVASVDQDAEQADLEEIATVILTVRGERALVPAFGIGDPAFVGLSAPEVVAAVTRWTPHVVTGVTVAPDGPSTQRATVSIQ